jgi:hypothetical protein
MQHLIASLRTVNRRMTFGAIKDLCTRAALMLEQVNGPAAPKSEAEQLSAMLETFGVAHIKVLHGKLITFMADSDTTFMWISAHESGDKYITPGMTLEAAVERMLEYGPANEWHPGIWRGGRS